MRSAVSTVVLVATLAPWSNAEEYLEPSVQRHVGVLPSSVCKQLIDLGDNAGFLVQEESIDKREQSDSTQKYIPSQTIDVYNAEGDEPEIQDPAIWNLLQPWIPTLSQIVKDNRNWEGFRKLYPNDPDREPKLDWIFFRKYSPYDERNALKIHNDNNMNTVNIELSSDYEGGGLFYIKPHASTGETDDKYYQNDGVGYEMIDAMKRENTSDIVFPNLQAGDAVFYNYTVIHGVAPVESGTRYSMAFFFDMDNPAVREDDDEDELLEGEFDVSIRNELTDLNLDILLVHDAGKAEEYKEKMFTSVRPREVVHYISLEGDLLQAVISGTSQVVSEIYATSDKPSFKIILREDVDTSSVDMEKASYEIEDEDEDQLMEGEFKVAIRNDLTDLNLDIMLVNDAGGAEQEQETLFTSVRPREVVNYISLEGDLLRAVISGTSQVVAEISATPDKPSFKISREDSDATYEYDEEEDELEEDEFEVKLRNGLTKNVDIVLVYDADERRAVTERLFGQVHPNRTSVYIGIEGDVLQAVVSGTDEVVSKIELERGQSLYTLSNAGWDFSGYEL